MCIGRKVFITATLFAATLLLMLPAEAVASPAVGSNSILDDANGRIFIPLKPATSGDLGSAVNFMSVPLPPGKKVGLHADSVTVGPSNPVSQGFVVFDLFFDIDEEVTPEFPIVAGGQLFLNLFSINFSPQSVGSISHWETVALQFEAGGTFAPNPTVFTIDETNYGDRRTDGQGFDGITEGVWIEYEIDLTTHLGVTPAEFAQVSADEAFTVWVTMASRTEGRGAVVNLAETFHGRDVAFVLPEPSAAVMLAVGSVLWLVRRRRQ